MLSFLFSIGKEMEMETETETEMETEMETETETKPCIAPLSLLWLSEEGEKKAITSDEATSLPAGLPKPPPRVMYRPDRGAVVRRTYISPQDRRLAQGVPKRHRLENDGHVQTEKSQGSAASQEKLLDSVHPKGSRDLTKPRERKEEISPGELKKLLLSLQQSPSPSPSPFPSPSATPPQLSSPLPLLVPFPSPSLPPQQAPHERDAVSSRCSANGGSSENSFFSSLESTLILTPNENSRCSETPTLTEESPSPPPRPPHGLAMARVWAAGLSQQRTTVSRTSRSLLDASGRRDEPRRSALEQLSPQERFIFGEAARAARAAPSNGVLWQPITCFCFHCEACTRRINGFE